MSTPISPSDIEGIACLAKELVEATMCHESEIADNYFDTARDTRLEIADIISELADYVRGGDKS